MEINSRRKFLFNSLALTSMPFLNSDVYGNIFKKNNLKIALQVYSLASQLMRREFDLHEFPGIVKNTYGLDGAEYWSLSLAQKENDKVYLKDLKSISDDLGISNLLILVDHIDFSTMKSGPSLSSSLKSDREVAVDYHKKWIDIAKTIGCHSIRINLRSEENDKNKILDNASESILKLIEYSSKGNISIVVENHGGITGDADWVVNLMKNVNHELLGTLPDFGNSNFCMDRGEFNSDSFNNCSEQYDKYIGVKKLLPYAKGISAKTHEFDNNGEEINTDFSKMIQLIKESSYNGYLTIEYEGSMLERFGRKGNFLSPHEGVLATKNLINKYL